MGSRLAKYTGLGLFVLLAVVPLLLGLIYCLLYSLGLIGLVSKGFTLQYWASVFAEGEIWQSLLFSLLIASTSMAVSIICSLALTILFRREFQQSPLSYVIYLPLAIPSMVAGFYSLQLLGKSGLLSRVSYQWGFIPDMEAFPDLTQDSLGIGIIFTHILLAIPFLTILFLNTWYSERLTELYALARTLGGNSQQLAWRLSIPVLLKKNFPTLVLYFIFVLGSYEIPLLLGRESPQMISVLISRKVIRPYDLMDKPEAFFIALIYSLLVLSLTVVILRKRKIS